VRPGKHNDQSASRRRAGESPPPPSDAHGQSVNVVGGWACKMVGSGWVSSAVAHASKHRLGIRRGDAMADWPPGTGDHRHHIRHGLKIG